MLSHSSFRESWQVAVKVRENCEEVLQFISFVILFEILKPSEAITRIYSFLPFVHIFLTE